MIPQLIGWLIMAVIFGGLFAMIAHLDGIRMSIVVFASTAGLVGLIVLAAFLIAGESS